jgi:aminoglycoside 3-N-acetyltransferase
VSGATPQTRESLRRDIEALGVGRGDAVLVRANVGAIGRVKGGLGESLRGALLDAVGEAGTIVSLAFTRTFALARLDRTYVFDEATPTTSGGLPKLLLETPGRLRSRHPTNSFVALGARAAEILAGHDERSSSFQPMERLLALGGRQIVIGCVEESPGFTTVHWAQHRLGLSTRSILRRRVGVLYARDGEVRLFRRPDIGGCSLGFHKLYPEYARAGLLRTGRVGKASAVGIDAVAAYALEEETLRRNPRAVLCDRPLCTFCRGTWLFNKRDMPLFYPRYALHVAARALGIGARSGDAEEGAS